MFMLLSRGSPVMSVGSLEPSSVVLYIHNDIQPSKLFPLTKIRVEKFSKWFKKYIFIFMKTIKDIKSN